MMLLTTSMEDVHSVLYLPPLRSLFKKLKLDSAPSMHISVLYPKSRGSEDLFNEWTRITKLLDPIMKPLDADEVDYNSGICRLGHKVMEDVMKPSMKKKVVLVMNVWRGGNISEVALVSFNRLLLYILVSYQPI